MFDISEKDEIDEQHIYWYTWLESIGSIMFHKL